jgi:uncharacterized PurR-regulated membrane protein YhhQ (DUF165 family)
MNGNPSYKICTMISAIYAIALFLPTIDIVAIKNINFLGTQFLYNLGAFIFPVCYTLSDSITEVYA